jgi:hypothetical protein
MANDKGGSALTGVSFTFYTSFDSATDTLGAATTTDSAAQVVKVTINARKAFYAFTPIVGAFNSGNITAEALAGLKSSVCRTPPLMICGKASNDFPSAADVGKGMLLVPGASGQWAPGTFGYLDYGNGATAIKNMLAANTGTDVCSAGTSMAAQQGNIASAPDYLNTRFDIYTNPLKPADCTPDGAYCPAANTRKDLVIKEVYTFAKQNNLSAQPADPTRPACGSAAPVGGSKTTSDWMELPSTAIPNNSVIGFPRDTCHYSGTCADGNIGNGTWNLSGYQASHPNVPVSLTTRYAIYKWERDNPGSGLTNGIVNTGDVATWQTQACNGKSGRCDYTATWTNYCSFPNPINGTARSTPKDRRILTVAVVDCSSDTGGTHNFTVTKWMDVFLTEPSWNRTSVSTSASQIYAEIAGVETRSDGSNAFQFYGRKKAVLLQ